MFYDLQSEKKSQICRKFCSSLQNWIYVIPLRGTEDTVFIHIRIMHNFTEEIIKGILTEIGKCYSKLYF